jgi:serine/threonine protein kinase
MDEHGQLFELLNKRLSSISELPNNMGWTVDQVSLLGRLHHRNLVNLVGYCEEKHQRILVYEYMSHGSLEQRLVGKLFMTSREYTCSTSCYLQKWEITWREKMSSSFKAQTTPCSTSYFPKPKYFLKLVYFGTAFITWEVLRDRAASVSLHNKVPVGGLLC